VKLNRVTKGIKALVLAKLEFLDPGGSVKDRMAFYMLQEAEKKGRLKKGGTIVEATSGNTGVGIAIYPAAKGYKAIFTIPDKITCWFRVHCTESFMVSLPKQKSCGMGFFLVLVPRDSPY
jgi:cysteine synthase